MKQHNAHIFMFVGAWLSLMALLVGGSVLLPPSRSASDASTALLYRYADASLVSRDRAVVSGGRSIIADIETMQLSLYEEGLLVKTFPILSKGRPGTPWETPTGNYVIQAREIKHLSSIGGTWMPYSMQFYGNFFIHGWPTYANGEDVPVGYSGGCIRLSTENAREVFEFIPRGAQVSVMGGEVDISQANPSRYFLRGEGVIPQLSAQTFLVQDVDGGHVLWSQGGDVTVPSRGLTRLLSVLTAIETVNQYKIVRMSELLLGKSVLRKHSIGAIDEMPAGVLVYPLLFATNDTATSVFASEHGEKEFVRAMNEKSRAIGMQQSIFSGPLSTDASTTTAKDLMKLLAYVKKNKSFLIGVTLAKNKILRDEDGAERFQWENRNPWIVSADGAFRGGITDVDEVGRGSAMLLFDIPVSEFNKRIIAFVVIDAVDLKSDISALRQFVSQNYVYGIESDVATFIPEEGDKTPGILERAKQLMELDWWLRRDEHNAPSA
jgi:hypothetical protein